jgi:hypothetical protein
MTETNFDEFSQKLYPEYLASLEVSLEPSAKMRMESLKQVPDYTFYKTSQSIVEWSRSEKLIQPFINSPVSKLFIYGEKNSWKKEALPSFIPTVEVSGAGHFMLADNPKETFHIMDDFVKRRLS